MAFILNSAEAPPPPGRRHNFGDKYPDFVEWLDGNVWELDIETEILPHESVNNFRASMYYQARTMGLRLATKTVWRSRPDGARFPALLIQAHPA